MLLNVAKLRITWQDCILQDSHQQYAYHTTAIFHHASVTCLLRLPCTFVCPRLLQQDNEDDMNRGVEANGTDGDVEAEVR